MEKPLEEAVSIVRNGRFTLLHQPLFLEELKNKVLLENK